MLNSGKSRKTSTRWVKPLVLGVTLVALLFIQTDVFSPIEVKASIIISPEARAGDPTITKIFPTTGPVVGNISVTISGANFGEVTAVSFGGVKASRFRVENPNSISATIPPGKPGAVKVVVRTRDKAVSLDNAFTYKALVSPTPTNLLSSTTPTAATSPGSTIPVKTATTTISNTSPVATTSPSPAVTVIATQTIPVTTTTQAASPTPTPTLSVSQTPETATPADSTLPVTTSPGSSPTAPISTSPAGSPQVTEVPTTPAPDPGETSTPPPVSTVTGTPVQTSVAGSSPTATSVTDPSPTPTSGATQTAPVTTAGVTPTNPTDTPTPSSPTGSITAPEETPATIAISPSPESTTEAGISPTPESTTEAGISPTPESTTEASISPTPESTTEVSVSPATSPAVTIVSVPSPTATPTTDVTDTPGTASPIPTFTPTDTPTPTATTVVSFSPTATIGDGPTPTPTPIGIGLPTITQVSPNSGPASGGTTVIIKGTNFTNLTQVTFGGLSPASVIFNSPTQITVVTAAQPAGVRFIEVKTGFGKTQLANAFTYSSQSVRISQEPTSFNYTGKLNGNVLVLKSTFSLGITDLSGSGAGWHLLARGSILTSGSGVIPVANHTIQNVRVITKSGPPPLNSVKYPLIFPVSDETIFSAAPGTGNGESIITFETQLVVPPEIPAGTYSFTLNLSVEPGP